MNKPKDLFSLAYDLVSYTSQTIFLTGKAGTGKTTFLKMLRENITKNTAVVAPTGIAAINAGGVTLHSFLQLPFEAFIPNFEGKQKLEYHLKLKRSKIEMFRELELLIIDEVSMLRADTLDAIDYIFKKCRNNNLPFGGVQLLFIGDLYQLPPVVHQTEWEELKQYYPSPYFFNAESLQSIRLVYIELEKIFRQSDETFVNLLNKIRNNNLSPSDYNLLNSKYNPDFTPKEDDGYVTLCTHNYQADQINKNELEKLPNNKKILRGYIKGNFNESSLPTELDLEIKIGAQVMFIKNESGEFRRYYNGKLGKIVAIDENEIAIEDQYGEIINLEKDTWRNVRYYLNEESGKIEEEELGHFSQYPIRLAWAITIHKSQGLTFDKLIIDAGQAFAAGQVYVALSRCTSLEGIVLKSKINENSIFTNSEIGKFASLKNPLERLQQLLKEEKHIYLTQQLKKQFDWGAIRRSCHSFYELVEEKKIPNQEETLGMAKIMLEEATKQEEIAYTFTKEIDRIITNNHGIEVLKTRVQKAILYFYPELMTKIISPLNKHINDLKHASRVKQYLTRCRELNKTMNDFVKRLTSIRYGQIDLTEGLDLPIFEEEKREAEEALEKAKTINKEKRLNKLDSISTTLQLFKDGKNIQQIANIRNITTTTVENHLVENVRENLLKPDSLISTEVLDKLINRLQLYEKKTPLKKIKEDLPDIYSYFEIKVVLAYLETFML